LVDWLKNGAAGAVVLAALVSLFIIAGRAGCFGTSHIVVEPLSATIPPPGPIYFLPRAMIGLDLSYQITNCDVTRKAGAPEVVSVDADIRARLVEVVEPDLTRGYVVRAESITGSVWRTDFTIEIQNGVLKRVNSISTAEFVIPKELQLEGALAQLAKTQAATEQHADKEALPSVEDRRIAICGRSLVEFLAKPPAERKSEDNPATMKRFFRFDPAGPCPADTTSGDPAQADRLVCTIPGLNTIGALLADRNAAPDLEEFTVQVRMVQSGRASRVQRANTRDLVYRTAGSALITVCTKSCSGGGRVLFEKVVAVPQFGIEGTIPIERRMFSDRTVQIDFGPAGDLTQLRFVDAAADAAKPPAAREPVQPGPAPAPKPSESPTAPSGSKK
jgi:hypothetical protein